MSTATSTATTDIRTAQLSAAALLADVDLDDATLWRQVDAMVAALATVAYDLTAAVTGEAPGVAANGVPPVVRVRELTAAQRRLFDALDRHPAPGGELVDRASRRLRQIGQELRWRVSGRAA